MVTRQLPRTSYGYLPPPGARARGWLCPGEECGRAEWSAVPRRWPYPCPGCGTLVDPILMPPWAHPAEGRRLRHILAGKADRYTKAHAEAQFAAWLYKDAYARGDRVGATSARREFRQAAVRMRERDEPWAVSKGLFYMVWNAVDAGDVDGAAEEILAWHPTVETDDLGENDQRTTARHFLSCCIKFLECIGSIGHPLESAVRDAMEDVAERAADVLTDHADGFKRISHLRATVAEATRIAEENRSGMATTGPALPHTARGGITRRILSRRTGRPVRERIRRAESAVSSARSGNAPEDLAGAISGLAEILREPELNRAAYLRTATALVDAALVVDQTHDDPGILLHAADQLDRNSVMPQADATVPSLVHLLRARAALAALRDAPAGTDTLFASAVAELRHAVMTVGDLAPDLLPEVHATLARLVLYREPEALDAAIEECRAGRRIGLRWWPRATAADTTLARLLVWRALQDGPEPARQITFVREAIRLGRRQLRPWHIGGTQARLVLNEALAARDALSGGADRVRRMAGWRKAVARSASSATDDRVRLAAAWVAWAVNADDADMAAEAYHHLISIVPLHAATRYRSTAKDRVLAAAQEHTEEAGYWLARAHRYRDAVVALETGRAVKLSEIAAGNRAGLADLLAQAREPALAERLRTALATLDDEERRPSGPAGPVSPLQRAWVDVRAAARSIAAVTGVDPLALEVRYDDVISVTGEGAVVYIAAAKAGGYALVVAARHDPQFIELPRFERGRIAELLDAFLPGASGEPPSPDRMADGLKWLWDNGMRDLMLMHARGPIVTLIPVGLLSLVPLHAAGDPGKPGDSYTEWRHAGHFSAVRYVPNARTLRRCGETAERLSGAPLSLLAVDVPDGRGVAGRHLAWAGRETEEVARIWDDPATALRHNCAWKDFREMAGDYAVWHLACHGRAVPGAIGDSTLYFADAQVTLDEIRAVFRPAPRRLAVLSSCESQLSGIANPNEAIGLPSALLQIGFAGVIATAWPIDDWATSYLMAYFYRCWLRERLPPAVALSRAQQWLRRATLSDLAAVLPDRFPDLDLARGSGRPRFSHPRHWAAFAYTGV